MAVNIKHYTKTEKLLTANSPYADADTLDVLASSNDAEIVAAVMANPHTLPSTLKKIAKKSNKQ
jgi:hypothetical protein